MRFWLFVDPACMCAEHIKRELREMRQVVDIVRGRWDVPTWVGDGSTAFKKLLSHAIEGQIDTTFIETRWRKLWDELDQRGESLDLERTVPEWPKNIPHLSMGQQTAEKNQADLQRKCPDKCAVRMGVPA